MKSITLICFVLLTGLSFVSCKKNSKKWITGEFQIIDRVTKEPVKATLELNYFAGYLFGSEEVTEQLGSTTDNGFLSLKKFTERTVILSSILMPLVIMDPTNLLIPTPVRN
ncbi:MAG: hypothetical protein IPO32_13685 [Crocinitomicaceae bacterium]|nr:hypothetical protein [Crocinitomicaceae bacterium]